MSRDAVNFIIGSHYAHDAGLLNGSLKAGQEYFSDNSFRIVRRGDVGAAFGLTVGGKMFGGGDDVFAVHTRPLALQSFNASHTHTRDQIRVFAIGLFGTPPARLARQIEIGTQHDMAAAGSGFEGSGGKDLADELGIPTAGEGKGLRKTGTPLSHMTVQDFVVKHRRDAQAGILNQPLLNRVGKDGSLAGIFSFSLAGDLPNAIFHYDLRLFRRKIAAICGKVRLWPGLWSLRP